MLNLNRVASMNDDKEFTKCNKRTEVNQRIYVIMAHSSELHIKQSDLIAGYVSYFVLLWCTLQHIL